MEVLSVASVFDAQLGVFVAVGDEFTRFSTEVYNMVGVHIGAVKASEERLGLLFSGNRDKPRRRFQ